MNAKTWKRLAKASRISLQDISDIVGIKQNSFSGRLSRDSIKDEERKEIAERLGADYVCGFLMPNGEFISDYSDAVGMKLADDKAEIIVSTLNNRKSQQVYTAGQTGETPTHQNPEKS